MDNLTHSLIGLVAGEAAARHLPTDPRGLPSDTRRYLLIAMGVAGGNLPDLDLLWSWSPGDGGLAYMLHHRGHTHTLLGCLLLAGLLALAVWSWMRWRRCGTSVHDRWVLGGMALASVLLHLGMDALNSYGVHPFWPFDNHWYYGDAVFIVEPLYWLAAAPLLGTLQRRGSRWLLGAVLLVASVALAFAHRGAWPWWVAPLPALLLAWWGSRLPPRAAASLAVALMLLVTVTFAVAARTAGQRALAEARQAFPGARTLDAVLTPAPAHPLCWDLMLLQTQGDAYHVRRGRLSLMPSLPAADCPASLMSGAGAVAESAVAAPGSAHVQWTGDSQMPRRRLVELATGSCRARAMMQFIRVPFAWRSDGEWILADLRFDRGGGGQFAMPVTGETAADCGPRVPWIPPRSDLTGGWPAR